MREHSDIFKAENMEALQWFPSRPHQLAIVGRHKPKGADAFFQKLMRAPFRVIGQVSKHDTQDEIKYVLEESLPRVCQADPFYEAWIADMAEICRNFCDVQNSDAVGFCLSTERGCRRYHIDNVPLRLLVTYAGQGTEWLPDEAADRRALTNGAPNEDIVKDPSARQFMKPWDVAVFRGGPKGLLHSTPDTALNGASVLMRLDHASFWDSILKQQQNDTFSNLAA